MKTDTGIVAALRIGLAAAEVSSQTTAINPSAADSGADRLVHVRHRHGSHRLRHLGSAKKT